MVICKSLTQNAHTCSKNSSNAGSRQSHLKYPTCIRNSSNYTSCSDYQQITVDPYYYNIDPGAGNSSEFEDISLLGVYDDVEQVKDDMESLKDQMNDLASKIPDITDIGTTIALMRIEINDLIARVQILEEDMIFVKTNCCSEIVPPPL